MQLATVGFVQVVEADELHDIGKIAVPAGTTRSFPPVGGAQVGLLFCAPAEGQKQK